MLKIVGYADRFSVRPGETIRFMVSSGRSEFIDHLSGLRVSV